MPIMKLKCYLLSSLACLQFSHAQDAQDVKIHNSLSTALQQVDTDGEFFKLEKSGQMMEYITGKLDEYALPEMVKPGELPADFSFVKILGLSGISDITAGSESVKKDGSSYISKLFVQTNGSRKGILSLLGESDKPWASLEYAPANTALLLETHLDLTAVPQLLKQIAPMLDERTAKDILGALAEKEPVAGNTLEQALLQANARISLIAEFDSAKTWGPPSQKLPVIHMTGRIDGIAKFLWENYGKVISENLPVKSAGNIHTIPSPEKINSPWGPLTPAFVIDTENNHIWFSLSEEHLQTCRAGKTKLSDNKDFQLANKDSRDQGAARIYVSKQVLGIAARLLKENLKSEFDEPIAKKLLTEVTQYLGSVNSISSCISHDDKGILVHTNAPFPVRMDQVGNVQIIASLAGLSYGPIMKHLEISARTEDIMKLKNIHSALLGYMAQNDTEFPDNLKQLVDGGHITKQYFTMKRRKLHYVKGLTPMDANKIILYTSPDKDGMAIMCRVDGSVKAIHHLELEDLLAEQ